MNQRLQSKPMRLQLVATAEWIMAVDNWRAAQLNPPNRSDAIRRLVVMALDAHKATAKAEKAKR